MGEVFWLLVGRDCWRACVFCLVSSVAFPGHSHCFLVLTVPATIEEWLVLVACSLDVASIFAKVTSSVFSFLLLIVALVVPSRWLRSTLTIVVCWSRGWFAIGLISWANAAACWLIGEANTFPSVSAVISFDVCDGFYRPWGVVNRRYFKVSHLLDQGFYFVDFGLCFAFFCF